MLLFEVVALFISHHISYSKGVTIKNNNEKTIHIKTFSVSTPMPKKKNDSEKEDGFANKNPVAFVTAGHLRHKHIPNRLIMYLFYCIKHKWSS